MGAARACVVSGSSPLARGLPYRHRALQPGLGIIPARAGFTAATRATWPGTRDHPRSRGVYRVADAVVTSLGGSSPLARGLREDDLPAGRCEGIIPARAGFTSPEAGNSAPRTDHPRSRGVYTGKSVLESHGMGSSPLARGLLGEIVIHHECCGIIPARAGFTAPASAGYPKRQDHPRSRGVYFQ